MAFIEESDREAAKSKRERKIKAIGERLRLREPALHVPPETHPIRASDIKGSCPRQVYYNRLAEDFVAELHEREGEPLEAVTNAAALYGTTVHTLFEQDAPLDRKRFMGAWTAAVINETPEGGELIIQWDTSAYPFKLVGFQRASLEEKLDALYLRYSELDRESYLWFWESRGHWAEIETELVLTGNFRGAFIRTTADVVCLDPDLEEYVVIDWKTGQPSEPTQLATYAMMAEARYGLEPGAIKAGYFVLTGAGVPAFERGKLPTSWRAFKDDRTIQKWDLDEWRPIVKDRVDKLLQYEEMGTWPPIYNFLCHNTCDFRKICPVGKAVQIVAAKEKE